jgi:hypothetical protein
MLGSFFLGDSIMLVCAVLASLAAGILVAYGVCLAFFSFFRMHTLQVAVKPELPVGQAAGVVEG